MRATLIIKEGAVWPPSPEEVEFSSATAQALERVESLGGPAWARVTEVGGDIGQFLTENMCIAAVCQIGNKLAEGVDSKYREHFLLGIRNAAGITHEQNVLDERATHVAIHEGSLVELAA